MASTSNDVHATVEASEPERNEDRELRDQAELEFDSVVKQRRRDAGRGDEGDRGAWGLALSGGGIRSATFCIGLVRGLAKNRLLGAFDYLSTVSGGGYAGVSFGRLFDRNVTARQVEDGVARDDSMWLWWLRNNGRYLTPAGAKDLGFATASVFRGIIATHGEVAVMTLLAMSLMTLPHVLLSMNPPPGGGPWGDTAFGQLGSVWWWLLAIPLFTAAHQVLFYWFRRERLSVTSIAVVAITATLSASLALRLAPAWFGAWERITDADDWLGRPVVRAILLVVLFAPGTALLSMLWEAARRVPLQVSRLARIKRLSYSLWAFAVIGGIGIVDWLSWHLAGWVNGGRSISFPYELATLLALLVAVGRLAAPQIQQWRASSRRRSLNFERTMNLLGCVGFALLLILWAAALNVALFTPSVWGSESRPQWFWEVPQLGRWLAVFGACVFYTVITRKSLEVLNLSSLHHFYRARIERAYVSTGNSGAGPQGRRFPRSPLNPVRRQDTESIAPLTDVVAHDDVPLRDYLPHKAGGPIHLINCCINQSIDDRTGLYNADRKGIALVVGALGVETGTHFAPVGAPAVEMGLLSRWIAVSGAAASTGMGSRTSPGLANILFMSGFRLGYWTRALHATAGTRLTSDRARLRRFLLNWWPKPFAIVAESLARFPGLNSSVWYVSDGGHFDNTGIYALLKRRPEVIVAADCGADPKYLFCDLENLVRKAKIDYGVDIEFLDPDVISAGSNSQLYPNLLPVLGTPETIDPRTGSAWLVVGRFTYLDGQVGTLLIVKPRRLQDMPFDIVTYADRNPEFPQQSTVDQFFDEAQWEAYHQLGLLTGRQLTADVIQEARAAVAAMAQSLSNLKLAMRASAQRPARDRIKRLGIGARASLGAGLSVTLLLAAWQGVEQFRQSQRVAEVGYMDRYRATLTRVDGGKLDPVLPGDFDDVVTFAEESAAREDGLHKRVMTRLNARCEAEKTPSSKENCGNLFRDLNKQIEARLNPWPSYDYWFADRRYRPGDEDSAAVLAANEPADTAAAPAGAGSAPAPIAAAAPPPPILHSPTEQMPPDEAPNVAMASQAVTSNPDLRPAPPPPPPVKACSQPGGVKVYLHIYDEISREAATLLEQRAQGLGARVPGIENVTTTAKRNGRQPPYVWTSPAVIYHAKVGEACRNQLAALIGDERTVQRALPAKLKNVPGVVEVWLPPRYEGERAPKSPQSVRIAP